MIKKPVLLLQYRVDKELEISIYYYPIANAVQIYLNGEVFDTIPLQQEYRYLKTWIEHPRLGRVQKGGMV